jgi:3-oxoacyl-ACP reductase-like protein
MRSSKRSTDAFLVARNGAGRAGTLTCCVAKVATGKTRIHRANQDEVGRKGDSPLRARDRDDAIFQHLSSHWLRLVTPSDTQVRARWPLDPTWTLLRREFGRLAAAPPLPAEALDVVRGAQYRGRARLLRKMANGLLNSLEVEDTSVASASLTSIQSHAAKWEEAMRRRAEKEAERLTARRARLLAKLEASEGLDQIAEDELRARLAVIEEGRGVALERPERVRTGCKPCWGSSRRMPSPRSRSSQS